MKTPPTKPSHVAMCPVRCSPFNDLVAAVLLLSAAGSGLTQPVIVTHPRDQTVALGATVSFTVSVSGTSPLIYQWRFEAVDLPGATNSFLNVPNVQLTNAGGYTLLLSNLAGAVTSRVAQLSVAGGGVFTNAQGTRLPYRLCLPPRYDPGTEYPLVLFWHGAGEVGTDNTGQLKDNGQFSFLTASNLAKFPCFYLAPQLPNYPGSCAEACRFTDCATNLLRRLQEEYSINPDRIYVTGLSMGGQVSWIMLARYPDLLAAVVPMSASWVCHSLEDFLQSLRVPVWNFHAADDDVVGVGGSDAAVAALRGAGASIVYTRYQSGRHAIWRTAYSAPVLVDWIMAQRRGVAPTNEPLLSITSPTAEATYVTTVSNITLAGSAAALGQAISQVDWTNTASSRSGPASGTGLWTATDIPLAPPYTNLFIVTATTTSWSAGLGGNTTFNDTLAVSWQLDRPFIITQPVSRTNRAGTAAAFSVAAYSALPMSYQWQFNTVPIDNATNAILIITNVQAPHEGIYTVLVSDANGSVTSAPAVLTLVFDPIIVQQPCSVSVPQGGSVTLSVAVTNTATLPISYGWARGFSYPYTPVASFVLNEYVSFLTLTNCQATANYIVSLTNATRTIIFSSRVAVTVLPDTDGDALPDSWEIAYGIDQASAHHGLADDDSDGLCNGAEYLAGTNPTNALSYLKVDTITLANAGAAAVLQFFAVSNKTYTVQYREKVDGGEWNRLTDVVATASNRVVAVSDQPAGANGRYYRLLTPRHP